MTSIEVFKVGLTVSTIVKAGFNISHKENESKKKRKEKKSKRKRRQKKKKQTRKK